MLITRVFTALILFALFLCALFGLPESGWMMFCALVMGAAAWEWKQLANLSGLSARLFPLLTALVFVALAVLKLPLSWLLAVFLCAAVFWLVGVPMWLNAKWSLRAGGNINILSGWAILLPAGLAMLYLRGDGWLLLAVLMVAWLADTFAYFSGVMFGKHKLAPSISPAKSWEGVAGALIAVALYGWFLPKPFSLFPNMAWSSGYLAQKMAWIGAGLVLVVVCVLGDLLESLLKRQAGVKDSSNLLPGHGGVLDRIDSLLALLPVTAAFHLAHELFFVLPARG